MDFLKFRRDIIRKYFKDMNDCQFEAITTVKGPLLVLAGAGSGKTTVLVNRILNLIKFGNAYYSNFIPEFSQTDIELGEKFLKSEIDYIPNNIFSVSAAKPWEILAITFTNKAADELKERIAARLGESAKNIATGTFHSICGKILRRNAHLLGYSSHFTIYDTDDQKRLIKDIMKQYDIDDKFVSYKSVLSEISRAKDKLISSDEYADIVGSDYRKKIISDLYSIYQDSLLRADAMDFDDMIVNTVRLLEKNDYVLEYYNDKFRYIMVDEYQDTNYAQYVLVSLLVSKCNNLCVVGDDDQSIYRFRGATIENILNFEEKFRNTKTIRLEQNYRSTSNILNAANAIIANNKSRKGKTLWTDNGVGNKLTIHTAADEREEARFIAESILENVHNGAAFSDHAVLYRINAQSNVLESYFARSGISYKVIGGTRFYDRKEIKDVISYLQLINNSSDNLRLMRIINVPKRGIGDTTVNKALQIANSLGVSIFEVLSHCDEYNALARSSAKIKDFCNIIENLTKLSFEVSLSELFENLLEFTGYITALEMEGIEGIDRINNVKEFATTIRQYEQETEEPTLSDFLEQIALVSDIDSLNTSDDKVVMLTVHSAKGLEFNNVYLIGMEEGIFPSTQSIYLSPEEIEEERRLAYVAVTRAKKNLTITNAYVRMLYGSTGRNMPSRFCKEIPEELCSFSNRLNKPIIDPTNYNSEKKHKRYTSSFIGSETKVKTSSNVYSPGQQVTHKTFGQGMIISVTPMANDFVLEIAFETVGTKKIMANYSKLTF